MADDRSIVQLGMLGAARQPDAAFAAELFDRLVTDLDFGPDGARGRSPGGRVRRALGLERLPIGETARRLAYVAALAGLLLALALGAALVASRLSHPDGPELVGLSQAVYDDPPAFTMTVRDPRGRLRELSNDGAGTWRIEDLAGTQAPGSWILYDGRRTVSYDASANTWASEDLGAGDTPPWPLMNEFTWAKLLPDGGTIRIPCDGARWIDQSEVAGHIADHLVCADIDMEYWLDRETHLVLRIEAGPETPGWVGGPTGSVPVIEAVALEPGAVDATAFSFERPAGVLSPLEVPLSTALEVGQPAPRWTTTDATGWPFDTDALRYPAVLVQTWMRSWPDWDAAAAAHPGVSVTLVTAAAQQGTVVGYLAGRQLTATPIADPNWTLSEAWGIVNEPILVVLDAEGDVARVDWANLSPASIDELLWALEAGAPLPEPELVDGESWEEPEDRIDDGNVAYRTRWWYATPWALPRLGGGTLTSDVMLGQPTFVVVWPGAVTTGDGDPELEWWSRAGALAQALGTDARVVIVSDGEPTAGWTADLVSRLGLEVPVVFDWDRTVLDEYRAGYGTLLFDAEGRLADAVYGVPDASTARAMLDRAARDAPDASPEP